MPVDYIPYLRKKIGHDRCLTVGLTILILDENDRVLLEKRSDNGKYCLPGGSIDLDETVMEGLQREVREETGITLNHPQLFLISSGKKTELIYPNGDVTDYVDIHFIDHVNSKEIHLSINDGESTSLKFYSKEELPDEENLLRGTKRALEKYYSGNMTVEID